MSACLGTAVTLSLFRLITIVCFFPLSEYDAIVFSEKFKKFFTFHKTAIFLKKTLLFATLRIAISFSQLKISSIASVKFSFTSSIVRPCVCALELPHNEQHTIHHPFFLLSPCIPYLYFFTIFAKIQFLFNFFFFHSYIKKKLYICKKSNSG